MAFRSDLDPVVIRYALFSDFDRGREIGQTVSADLELCPEDTFRWECMELSGIAEVSAIREAVDLASRWCSFKKIE